jgi:hypothetical protein
MSLDDIAWEPLGPRLFRKGDLPWVTHRGILKLPGLEIEVLQLSNGQRVLSEESLGKALEWLTAEEA